MTDRSPGPRWRKSTQSEAQNCVEVAYEYGIRDSKRRAGPVLAVVGTAFDALVAAVRSGIADSD